MADFFDDCYDPRMNMTQKDFIATFCNQCRNQDCERAARGMTKWIKRMSTQEDRLLINPRFADLDDPRYKSLQVMHFQDMLNRAYQLEISDQKGDWEIPEIHITDGKVEHSSSETNHAVEQAVKALRGGVVEDFVPETKTVDPVVDPVVDPPISKQTLQNTQIPSGGIMIGDAKNTPLKGYTEEEKDPWEIPPHLDPSIKKIEVGAKIVVGKKNESKS